jgi:hypothetical protein
MIGIAPAVRGMPASSTERCRGPTGPVANDIARSDANGAYCSVKRQSSDENGACVIYPPSLPRIAPDEQLAVTFLDA